MPPPKSPPHEEEKELDLIEDPKFVHEGFKSSDEDDDLDPANEGANFDFDIGGIQDDFLLGSSSGEDEAPPQKEAVKEAP